MSVFAFPDSDLYRLSLVVLPMKFGTRSELGWLVLWISGCRRDCSSVTQLGQWHWSDQVEMFRFTAAYTIHVAFHPHQQSSLG
jgi:hypothetical protein